MRLTNNVCARAGYYIGGWYIISDVHCVRVRVRTQHTKKRKAAEKIITSEKLTTSKHIHIFTFLYFSPWALHIFHFVRVFITHAYTATMSCSAALCCAVVCRKSV